MILIGKVDDEIAEVKMRRREQDEERCRNERDMAKKETERNREIERQREKEIRESQRERLEKARVRERERIREQKEREDAVQKRELEERELQRRIMREFELEREMERARAFKMEAEEEVKDEEEEEEEDEEEEEEEEEEFMAPFLLKQTGPSAAQGRRAPSQSTAIREDESKSDRREEMTAFKGEYDMSGAGGLKAILGSQSSGVRALTKAEIRAELARVSMSVPAV